MLPNTGSNKILISAFFVAQQGGTCRDDMKRRTTDPLLALICGFWLWHSNKFAPTTGISGPSQKQAYHGGPGMDHLKTLQRQFHDGKTIEATDVIASINEHRGEDSKSTVTFILSGGNADFPFLMSDYHLAIRPAAGAGIDVASPVGAGAYTLKDFEPGVRCSGEKFANFHDDSKGNFDGFQIVSIVDPAARQNALVTGEVDLIDRVDLKTAHLLKRKPGVEVESTTGT